MAIPTILPDQPTGLVEINDDGSFELVLPWARSITVDEPTMRVGMDPAIPVAIDEDVMSLPRRLPTAPITDEPTRALHRFSVPEKLVVMRALAAVATAAGVRVLVSAMPSYAPEKVHLHAHDWRTFSNWLQAQASVAVDFEHVRLEVSRVYRETVAARNAVTYTPPRRSRALVEEAVLAHWDDALENLRHLAKAVPQMAGRAANSWLHLPLTED